MDTHRLQCAAIMRKTLLMYCMTGSQLQPVFLSVCWDGLQANEQTKVVSEKVAEPASLIAQPRLLNGTQRIRRQLRFAFGCGRRPYSKDAYQSQVVRLLALLGKKNPGLTYSECHMAVLHILKESSCCVLPLMRQQCMATQHLSPVTHGQAPWGANRIQALRTCQSSNL
jgi:hypothetical protein